MKLFAKAMFSGTGFLLIAIFTMATGYIFANKQLGAATSDQVYTPPTLSADKITKVLLPPIVRLHDAEGKFFCSGTVISDKLIATANHCIDRGMFGVKAYAENISIRSLDGKDIGVTASVVGGNARSDTAIISGDFSKFRKKPIISDVNLSIGTLLNNQIPLIACGFPWGDELYCSYITNRSFYNFLIVATGVLFPGMSGGPVMIATTGEVVAVNVAALGQQIVVSPTGSIFVITGAKKNE